MADQRAAWGEGPGAVTQDGCAVDVYLALPYRGEVELLAAHLPRGCSVLDLGCGTGRLTIRLLDRGCAVTAVDHSPDMLAHVPGAATKALSAIEALELGRTFDVALLASNLINTGSDALRRDQLAACRRHLAPGGVLLFQRFDPAWLRALQPGPFPSIGEVEIVVERALHRDPFVEISLRYTLAGKTWRQHFVARTLDNGDVERELRESGFGAPEWIDVRWGAAAAA